MIKIRIMGKLKFFSLLMVAGMFAACSDNLENPGNENDGPKTGEGYVKVAINLPSVSGSRATDPTLDHGTDAEYNVNNGIIAFFEGTTESDATFVKAYDLGNLADDQDKSDQTSQISNKVVQVAKVPLKTDDSNNMYALAILNYGKNGKFASVDNDGKRLTLANDGEYIILTPGSKINALNGDVKWKLDPNGFTDTDNGFLMMNAPLYNGTTSQSQTLVKVEVYDTEAEAKAAGVTPDNIYVERIVAKVDVKIAGDATELTVKDGVYANDKVVFSKAGMGLGWTLTVTNKNTKPLRDVSGLATWIGYEDTYRNFVGAESSVATNLARIYWAIDNNYDDTDTDFNVYSKDTPPSTWKNYTDNNVQYCLENTAPAASYNGENTTSILIKAQYLVDGSNDANKSFFKVGDISTTYLETDFLSYVLGKLGLTEEGGVSLSINSSAVSGYYEGGDLRKLIEGIPPATSEIVGAITISDAQLNAVGKVGYYKNGDCYYWVTPIKHFTDLVYNAGDTMTDEKYLGLYGVVRNNWYELTINSVSGPGEPEIVEPEGPVVKEEGYINCSINVLSWAKRSQGVNL